jgi:hypothetical protein
MYVASGVRLLVQQKTTRVVIMHTIGNTRRVIRVLRPQTHMLLQTQY